MDQIVSIIISVLLGLGLAALFRHSCKSNSCVVIKGPDKQDVTDYYYKLDDVCYKYEEVPSKCV